jgi:arylsulfatase A-like enzyme
MKSSITRRALAGLTAGLAVSSSPGQTGARPPNIVFLISDDHSAPDLGCYGNQAIRTPNLDRLASQGVRYDRAYVTSPQCSPNRSAILTGEFPHTIGTSRLHVKMPERQTTIVEHLKERGYFIGAFRKVHQGPEFEKRLGFYRGPKAAWKEFFDALPADRPFFLHAGFTDPHRPYSPGAVSPPHDPAMVRIPEWLPDTPEIRRDLALYYDEIARMDRECGEILSLLDQRGLAENTLVVFTGDNGMPFPPRAKGTLYEDGIRVPLLARWPGRLKPGTVSTDLVSHLDLPVAWLAAAGVRKPAQMAGVDFLSGERRDHIFAERNWHGNFDPSRCIRTATHKLIFNAAPDAPYRPISDLAESATWESYLALAKAGKLKPAHATALEPRRPVIELYDLERDPKERNNVAESSGYAAVRKDLLARLTDWMNNTNDFLSPPFRIRGGREVSTL